MIQIWLSEGIKAIAAEKMPPKREWDLETLRVHIEKAGFKLQERRGGYFFLIIPATNERSSVNPDFLRITWYYELEGNTIKYYPSLYGIGDAGDSRPLILAAAGIKPEEFVLEEPVVNLPLPSWTGSEYKDISKLRRFCLKSEVRELVGPFIAELMFAVEHEGS